MMKGIVVLKSFLLLFAFTVFHPLFTTAQLWDELTYKKDPEKYSLPELYELAADKNKSGDYQNALFIFLRVINETASVVKHDNLAHEKKEEFKLFADASTHAGIIYFNRGDYPRSLEYFYEALHVYQLTENADGEGNLLNNIGTVYFDWSEYELALDYFLEAEKVFAINDFINKKTVLLNNIGGVYVKLENHDKGRDFFKRSIEAAVEENIEYTFNQLYNIGYSYYVTKNLKMAAVYFEKSLSMAQKAENRKDSALAWANLARVHMDGGNFSAADSLLSKAMETAQKEGALDEQRLIYQIWSELQENRYDFQKALYYHKQYFQINDSLFNAQKHAQIKELQVLYETEKREKEIQLLNIEKQFKTHQIESQTRWIYMLINLIVIVSFLLVVVYLQKRKQTRANLDLVRKNLEIIESEKRIMKKEDTAFNNEENFSPQTELQPGQLSITGADNKYVDQFNAGKYHNSNLSDELKKEILNNLKEKMQKKHLYRNANITLDHISELLGTNRTYISQVINEETGENFISFVNNYRIKEARRMLADDNYYNLTIEAIARHVGFNSKSSFNTFFKKTTGITPSYFQRNARIGKEN